MAWDRTPLFGWDTHLSTGLELRAFPDSGARDHVEPQFEGERRLVNRAGYLLQLEGAHRDELRATLHDWSIRSTALAETVLALAGSTDPRQDAQLLAAAVDGLRLEQLTDPRPGFRERAEPLLERLVRALSG